ncbi:uncharacterized membrane protein YqaE (UPF0057 family) [Pontibacter ummariensis]|uniref:Uncharacterized membrane protein YqaE, homolog of Blt101, UPF0057 family n=1 Tax=Pontibacter ummariensis TaxID=1610492 RepID=A0A239BTT9_9BACT|nr:YqaE/Pmp3 family membrane protein [Pontibacter ummariensis]PRY15618.1 uncharacterized membrane protein YqaE (UPF0057 family) [Pontibacter ummariensis]SNS11437.1 Uncharacterized membrane protein YqaE, homolog of Blt101, UPF0057 family [Pontibacter ummariensis]
MKLKNLLHLVAVLVLGQMMFACSSAKYYEFAPNKPEAYNTVKKKAAPATAEIKPAPMVAKAIVEAEENKATTQHAEPVMEASAAPALVPRKTTAIVKEPVLEENLSVEKREMSVAEAEALAMAKERLKNMTKAEKKELKRDLKEVMRQGGSRTSIVEIILAVLLPPLAVFLHEGIGSSFWISVILTLLFYIPGIIYALLVVTDTI